MFLIIKTQIYHLKRCHKTWDVIDIKNLVSRVYHYCHHLFTWKLLRQWIIPPSKGDVKEKMWDWRSVVYTKRKRHQSIHYPTSSTMNTPNKSTRFQETQSNTIKNKMTKNKSSESNITFVFLLIQNLPKSTIKRDAQKQRPLHAFQIWQQTRGTRVAILMHCPCLHLIWTLSRVLELV